MQYNIFKVSKKNLLIRKLLEEEYEISEKIIESGGYKLSLYYKKKDNSQISWQNVLNKFNVNISIDKDSLKGILIADNGTDMYAITYGMGSALVQKYCDSEFPMDIAKRVNVSKVKRKASKILNGSTNSLVRTLTNSDYIVLDRGESVVNLELVPDENENLGKSVGIGKSLRFNIDKDIELFDQIVTLINNINSRMEKRPIPLILLVKDEELLKEIWNYINDEYIKQIENVDFCLEDMNILGCSIFFDDDYKIELAFKNYSEEVPFLNTNYVRKFIKDKNIDINEVYKYLKIRYITDDGLHFVKRFVDSITFDFSFEGEKYVLYDGNVYYYNKDYLDNIKDGMKNINFEKYNKKYDFSSDWYKQFLEDNNYVDVKEKNKKGKETIYREQALNIKLSEICNYDNMDRNIIKICKDEDYKIEIADIAKEGEELFAVKIGTPRDFCYAIDQSIQTVDAFLSKTKDEEGLIEKYQDVKKIGLWLYVTGNNKFFDEKNDIDIFSFDSIMFLNKLTEWANRVVSANKEPVIRINYYKQN